MRYSKNTVKAIEKIDNISLVRMKYLADRRSAAERNGKKRTVPLDYNTETSDSGNDYNNVVKLAPFIRN
jgi:hypothetical protein